MADNQTAYLALKMLAAKSLNSAQQLPAQSDVIPQWSGVGFSLMGIQFVVPMGEIAETLEVPNFTRLPGVHSWAKGVANVRGRLLPLFDMAEFFGGHLVGNKKQQRVLVLDADSIYSGLWVDRIYGMQHFPVDTKMHAIPDTVSEEFRPFIVDGYQTDDKPWFVFSPKALLEDGRFLDVALN